MSRRRTLAALVLGLPAAVVLLAAAALAWILWTEAGSRWAVDQARPYLPGNVRLGGFEGVLAGPFTLTGAAVETDAVRVSARRLRVDWSPADLLRTEIRVTGIDAGPVEVAVRGTGGDAADGADGAPAPPEDLMPPLPVTVERLEVTDVALSLPGAPVERIHRVAFRARAGPDGFAVEAFELSAERGGASGSLRLDPGQPFGLDGRIAWRLRLPDDRLPAFAGTLRVGGSLRRLQGRLRLDEPEPATLRVELRPFATRPGVSGSLRLPPARLDAWWREAPALVAGAELQFDGTPDGVDVQGDARLEGLPIGPLGADLDLRVAPDSLAIRRLALSSPRRPQAVVTASGRLEPATEGPRFDLAVDWRELQWPLAGDAIAGSESGRIALSGTPRDYRLHADGRLDAPRIGGPPVQIELAASGSATGLSTLEAAARWHEAVLTARGRVGWSPAGTAQLSIELDDLAPGRFLDALEGRLGARAELQARWDETLTATLDLRSLDGRLNGRPVAGSARLRRAAGRTEVRDLRLRAGEAELAVDGRAGDELAFDWRARVPDLGQLVPGWGGRVAGEGRLEGTPDRPRVLLQATATGLAAPDVRAESVSLDGFLSPLGGRSDLRLEAAGVAGGAVGLERLRLALAGTPDDHRLEASAESERGRARVLLAGGLDGRRWSGRLREGLLAPAAGPAWSLEDPVSLAIAADGIELDRGCWRSRDARLCGTFSGGPDRWRARAEAERIPVGLVASRLRDDLQYDGRFGFSADLAAEAGTVTGEARLDLGPGSVTGTIETRPETLLAYRAGRIEVVLTPGEVDAEGDLRLAGDGRVRVAARVGRGPPHALDGRVQARIEDLGLVSVLSPAIGRMKGTLVADVGLGGSLEDPALAGSAALESGLVEIVPLGIRLTDLDAALDTADRGADLTLRARSGGGPLTLRARIQRSGGRWSGTGRVTGTDFEAVDLPEATVTVTPDIDWRLEGRDLAVAGRVTVPSARIAPRDLSGTVQTSPDTVIVGREAGDGESRAGPLRVTADVRVELGDRVRVDAFGLEGRLEGAIDVVDRPGQVTEATGELRVVDGRYSIYAQTLQIERGRLLFDGGPAANPGLDVRAVRRPRDVLVGVNVRGRLREPRVTLFSEPPMQESEQLSYLLFGVPLNQASEGQQSNLAMAAAALAASEQGSRLAGQVGIQEVTVDDGGPGQGASLVLGRYLSPRLYVGYGIGLMEQANSVRIRYDLTRHWTLEARSGVTSSADLLYSIEVDSSAEALSGMTGTGNGEPAPPPAERAR